MVFDPDSETNEDPYRSLASDPYDRAIHFQDELIGFFTGTSFEGGAYAALRKELLEDPRYGGLAPTFLRRNRDTGALWSFAKSVDGSWEPRRQFVRKEFEPLLEFLEKGGVGQSTQMPGAYDSSAWTGVQDTKQQAKAVRTLIPVAQASVQALINHLEQPGHNGGPPLKEVEDAIKQLRLLHKALGELLTAAEGGGLSPEVRNGLLPEIARFGRRATKALKDDPMPYAMSAALLAIFAACGVPGIGGYLSGVALTITKRGSV